MNPPGTRLAASCAAITQTASAWPRLRAAFLLPLALFCLPPVAQAQTTPAFLNWPSAITNFFTNIQVAYTNGPSVPGNPNMIFSPAAPSAFGLAATNVSGPVTVQAAPGTSFTNGFGVVANAGQTTVNNTNYILLHGCPVK
jgi:hypothetical protein